MLCFLYLAWSPAWDAFGDDLDFDAAFFGFGGDVDFGVDVFGLGDDFVFVEDFFAGDFLGVGVYVCLRVYCRAYPLFSSSRLLSSSSNDEMFSYSDPSSEHELGEDESLKYISCLGDGVHRSTSFFLEARRAERRVGGVFIDLLFVKIAEMYIIKFRFISYGNTNSYIE